MLQARATAPAIRPKAHPNDKAIMRKEPRTDGIFDLVPHSLAEGPDWAETPSHFTRVITFI
jgi:hypothetical protein